MRRLVHLAFLLVGLLGAQTAASGDPGDTGGPAPSDTARAAGRSAEDSTRLDRILGVRRQLKIVRSSPAGARRDIFGTPSDRMAPDWPEPAMVTLQAASETLVFMAAYRSGNTAAMAAVTAMSLWGGVLRKGIDAAAGAAHDPHWHVDDLHRLSERDVSVLAALWIAGGHSDERSLYVGISGFASRQDLSDTLKNLAKRNLVAVRGRDGARNVQALLDRRDAIRAFIASGQSDRALWLVNLPIDDRDADERSETRYGVTTQRSSSSDTGRVDP